MSNHTKYQWKSDEIPQHERERRRRKAKAQRAARRKNRGAQR